MDSMYIIKDKIEDLSKEMDRLLKDRIRDKKIINNKGKELEQIKKNYKILNDKYKRLKKESDKLNIIINYDEAVNKSEDLGMAYLEKVNWSEMNRIIYKDYLMTAFNMDIIDQYIFILESILLEMPEGLYKSDVDMITYHIEKLFYEPYIIKKHRDDIIELLEILYINNNIDHLKEFTINNIATIENLILNDRLIDNNLYIDIIRILYVEKDLNKADLFLCSLEENLKSDDLENISRNRKIDLAMILVHIIDARNIEDVNINAYNFLSIEDKYINIIKDYIKVINMMEKRQVFISKYKDIFDNSMKYKDGNIEENIRSILHKYMFQEIDKLENIEMDKKNEILRKEVLLIDNNIRYCIYDSVKLNIEKKPRQYLIRNSSEESIKIKDIDLLVCPNCNKYYINKNMLEDMSGSITYSELDKDSEKKKINRIKVNPDIDNKYKDFDVKKIEVEPGKYELRETSPLKDLGYHTGLSNDERWDILTNKCIESLGLNKVLFYLNGFVKRFSNQNDKDYSMAIRKWNNDIDRIEREFLF